MDKDKWSIDAFFSEYLGGNIAEIPAGGRKIFASKRRERKEKGYGPIFALWLLVTKARCAISVQERLLGPIVESLKGRCGSKFCEEVEQHRLTELVCEVLGNPKSISTASGPIFYCTPKSFLAQRMHPCRAVSTEEVLLLEGLYTSALDQSIREGSCFAAFHEDAPVSIAGTHDIGHMKEQIGDIAVETREAYRRRGFGKTTVSHTTEWLLDRDRVPIYATSDWNIASKRTAQSVGYMCYGWQFRVQVRATE